MTSDEIHEVFYLWPAFQVFAAQYRGHRDARDVRKDQLGDIAASIHMAGDRAASLLHAHGIGDTVSESASIVEEVLVHLHAVTRPRYGRELGYTVADFARLDEEAA